MTVAILRWCILFLAAGATLTISIRDARAAWAYEFASFVVAAVAVRHVPRIRLTVAIPLAIIALWGFVQLALHATVNRDVTVDAYLTMDASVRMAAFAATFIASATAFSSAKLREMLAAYLAWLGFAIALVGVLAYYTSPGKFLWIFASPYPDTWGFFLSRNNFAQFLELALPAALWRARSGSASAIAIAAAILAAGVASASRAGAILLAAETLACLLLMRRAIPTKVVLRLSAAIAIFIAIAGASQLWTRLHAPDPLEYRREFVRSSLAMIAEHPWRGFGLGTFGAVYPSFAEFDPGATVTHAHNDWLEWASEGGVPFAAAWIALGIALVRPAVRSIWGIGVLAILLHALVDFPFARVGTAACFFVIAGAIAVFDDPLREASRDRH
jgi:O-antigen ligase